MHLTELVLVAVEHPDRGITWYYRVVGDSIAERVLL
jgi:hypothetical protein